MGPRRRLPTLNNRMVIGIAGPMGAGKTSAGKYLSAVHGFGYLRYSLILARHLNGSTRSKRALQDLGWKVMSQGFQKKLNELLLRRIEGGRDYAVDGLRHPIDYRSLKRAFGSAFFLVYIEAPAGIRFQRLRRKGRFKSMAEFRKADRHPVEHKISGLRLEAHAVVRNDKGLRHLYRLLDGLLLLSTGGRQ